MSLGVCSQGLLVYHQGLRVRRYAWPRILRLAYHTRTFLITLRPSPPIGSSPSGTMPGFKLSGILPMRAELEVVMFKLTNHRETKRWWRLVVEHHGFFR